MVQGKSATTNPPLSHSWVLTSDQQIAEDAFDGSTWGVDRLISNQGKQTITIPACIAPGQYLLRGELIALHSASSYPGAQFYPGCHQVKVSGGGSKTPTGLVAFPGAYKASDAGITYDAYKAQTYTVPGPALFTC